MSSGQEIEEPKSLKPVRILRTENQKNNRHSIFTITERRDLEQYFWTDATTESIKKAIGLMFGVDQTCCMCTPSLAVNWWVQNGKGANLLDIDARFQFLPKFRYFDLRKPKATDLTSESELWRIIVFDPPFFYIPMETLFEAVMHVCGSRVEKTKLLMVFLRREEEVLLDVFAPFKLKRT